MSKNKLQWFRLFAGEASFNLSFLILFSLLSCSASAQVKIKEKVKINPSSVNISNHLDVNTNYYPPCGSFPDNPVKSSDSYIEFWYPTWYG